MKCFYLSLGTNMSLESSLDGLSFGTKTSSIYTTNYGRVITQHMIRSCHFGSHAPAFATLDETNTAVC